MKTIQVGKYEVMVDDWNYERVSNLQLNASVSQHGSGTVRAHWWDAIEKTARRIPLSRLLVPTFADQIDHEDRNWLNFQVENLRPCDKQQNKANQRKIRFKDGTPSTSRYKGVSWLAREGAWSVAVGTGASRKRRTFHSEIDAAITYDQWARERWGEFAVVNFPNL